VRVLQHVVPQCDMVLQHVAPQCEMVLQHVAPLCTWCCNMLHHSATWCCNMLHRSATLCTMLLYYVEREWGIKVYGYVNGTIRTQSRASRQAVAERHTMVRPRHDYLTTNVQHTHARCSTHRTCNIPTAGRGGRLAHDCARLDETCNTQHLARSAP
jgi:hypothetical protein